MAAPTRDALIAAALDLFEAKGYEHTAVHEITDAVDVSERTFFRYFASKEDLALSCQEGAQLVRERLAARPPEEEPLDAMRAAGRESVADLRPRILAAAFGALVFLATREWRTGGAHDVEAMLAQLDTYAAQLGPALAGHRGRPAG